MADIKAVLFDIGGVCVASPLGAIAEFERQHGLPKDYINFAISRSSPNGSWQRLERGEIKLDDGFFEAFRRDLHNPKHWEQYHTHFVHGRRQQKQQKQQSLKDLAGAKATQLGDPVSLKAETSDTNPTPSEAGAAQSDSSQPKQRRRRSFKDMANKTMLGDPISLKTETNDKSPLPDDSGAGGATSAQHSKPPASQKSSNSLKESFNRNMLGDPISLQNETIQSGKDSQGAPSRAPDRNAYTKPSSDGSNSLKESYSRNMLGDPTSLKNEGSARDPLPDQQDTGASKGSDGASIPPLPTMDTTTLFWDMMGRSRAPDPHMIPALETLRRSGKYVIAALSNTVIFPPDHEYSAAAATTHRLFDVFVSSAHVGLRKPDPAIYRMALDEINRFAQSKSTTTTTTTTTTNNKDAIRPNQIVFLDDIGANLRPARELGFCTIKVNIGHVDAAVAELERATGLSLAGKSSSSSKL